MGDWKIFVNKIKELLKSKNLSAAKEELAIGLEKIPNQLNLLTIATDIYRASNDHEKSLEYAELLITHHPDKWNGYGRTAQDLVALKRFEEAQEKIQSGLEKIPNQINLLNNATNVYRASDDREKSLEYSELLITHHPDNWNGYGRAAQDLVALQRFEEAQEKIQAGLEKVPNQVNLLNIASQVYRASGDRDKSLEYSELLITHHPDNWNGYGRAAQDLVALKRFEKAQEKIQAGLEKIPNQVNLLTIATDVYRASGDREKSLEYSDLLITHHPENATGHTKKIILLLNQCKEYKTIKTTIDNANLTCKSKNRFLHGIKHNDHNWFKKLWVNSFAPVILRKRLDPTYSHQPFQYWSQGIPPRELLEIFDLWNCALADGGIKPILLFNKESAGEWIKENANEFYAAFNSSFHPAVEADIFRIAYALKCDCIWIDSDTFLLENTISTLQSKLESGDTTLCFREARPWLCNGFFATKASSPFFLRIGDQLKNFTFAGKEPSTDLVMNSFGPARYNKTLHQLRKEFTTRVKSCIFADEASFLNFDSYKINFINECNFPVVPPWQLNYKTTNRNWIKFLQEKTILPPN